MVRALALRSGDPGFKTRSDHSLNLFLAVPGSTFQLHCVSLALKRPYGERSIKYVLYCIVMV